MFAKLDVRRFRRAWLGICLLISTLVSNECFPLEPSPEQDDAALNALSFLGPKTGWVVGDMGVIWKTVDGGRQWTLLPCPLVTHWNSVCFLTDRIGWIAGGHTLPYTQHNVGYVLATQDGGLNWDIVVRETWPRFHHIQFFDQEHGIAACDGSTLCPAGVLRTSDGGRTWEPAAGDSRGGWRAAAFVSPTSGIVGGLRGEQGYLADGNVQQSPLNQFGLRGLRGCSLDASGRGWLVGDGATIQTTDKAGVTWQSPSTPLSRRLKDSVNFRAVSHRDDRIWIAGAPGSVVFHSPDGGRTWQSQATGNPAPLKAIRFVSDHHGFAVGDFGRILRTEDGGTTWVASRAADRRVALLNVHAQADDVPYGLTTRTAHEQGYRVASYLFNRQDISAAGDEDTSSDERANDAFLSAGGVGATTDWRLPVTLPELSSRRERLVEEWSLLTEQKLGDAILNGLVTAIRTWRPDVIVIDDARPDDIPAELLREALKRAIPMAADPGRYPEHFDELHLQPWTTNRVFAKDSASATASITIDPHEVLPRLGMTLRSAALPSLAILSQSPPSLEREAFTRVSLTGMPDDHATSGPGLFTGLDLPPGGPARRALPPLSDVQFDELARIAQKQRHVDGYLKHVAGDEARSNALLAQVPNLLGGLPPAEAALQLAGLARRARSDRDWPLAERSYALLIDLYPNEPVAREAVQWLLTCWISEEVCWQRTRGANITSGQLTVDQDRHSRNLKESLEFLKTPRSAEEVELFLAGQKSAVEIQPAAAELGQGDSQSVLNAAASAIERSTPGVGTGNQADKRSQERERWQQQATRLEAILPRVSPAFLNEPEIQFALAAHWRRVRQHGKSDKVFDQFLKQSSRDPWHRAALGEVWLAQPATLSPKPVAACRRTPKPPMLDGELDDDCWAFARTIPLLSQDEAARGESFVGSRATPGGPGAISSGATQLDAVTQLAYDDKYLYLAGRFKRVAGLPDDAASRAGRTHDEDLTTFDRLSLFLDIDRDYRTSYRFDVDQRGHTRESCWEDQQWNPKWHVASAGDDAEWRIEAAIPLDEIVATNPGLGTTWAVGLVRTLPAVGYQAWTHPTGDTPLPAAFGLLRFE